MRRILFSIGTRTEDLLFNCLFLFLSFCIRFGLLFLLWLRLYSQISTVSSSLGSSFSLRLLSKEPSLLLSISSFIWPGLLQIHYHLSETLLEYRKQYINRLLYRQNIINRFSKCRFIYCRLLVFSVKFALFLGGHSPFGKGRISESIR